MNRSPSQASVRSSVTSLTGSKRTHLLEDLVRKFKNDESHVAHYEKLLRFHKYPSTDHMDIQRRLQGMVNKFSFAGLDAKSEALDDLVKQICKLTKSFDVYDLLSFILSMSESPTHAAWDAPDAIIKQDPHSILKWKDVIASEPLEGYHWSRQPQYENDDEGYDEGVVIEDHVSYVSYERAQSMELIKNSAATLCRVEVLKELKTIQYWNRKPDSVCEQPFVFKQPTTLSPALAHHEQTSLNHFHCPRGSLNYVSEIDLIREILFMLSGTESFVFKRHTSASYTVQLDVSLTHATPGAVYQILSRFAEVGSMISRIKDFNRKVQLDVSTNGHSRTIQTFADAATNLLRPFDSRIVDLQRHYQSYLRDMQNGVHVASLLRLWETLDKEFPLIHDIHGLIERLDSQSPFIVISMLCDLVNEYLLVNSRNGPAILQLLVETLRPIVENIEEWMNEGTITSPEDSLIEKLTDAQTKSTKFWFDAFCARDVPISFLSIVSEDAMVTGKSRILLNECRMAIKHPVAPVPLYGEFVSALALDMGMIFKQSPTVKDTNNTDFPISVKYHLDVVATHPPLTKSSDTDASPLPIVSFETVMISVFKKLMHSRRLEVGRLLTQTLRNKFGIENQIRILPRCCFMLEGEAMSAFCLSLYEQIESKRVLHDSNSVNLFFTSAMTEYSTTRVGLKNIRVSLPEKWTMLPLSFLALDDLHIDYMPPWPTSLLVSKSIISVYNEVARLLVQARIVQLGLERDAVSQTKQKSPLTSVVDGYTRSLRLKMLQFVQGLLSHFISNAIAENVKIFDQDMSKAVELDEMIQIHARFVQTVHHQCLLHPRARPVLTPIRRILELSCDFLHRDRKMESVDESLQFLTETNKEVEDLRKFIVNALRSSRGQQLFETLSSRLDF
ncbi:hypothetical protein SmJEL517_g04723 [Synchytrium microbalum]|uniref:Spindle pole body component n=1 Tax=Synchytrium microbalum TaxID=1806994 RepID=A0A507BYD8_9FUNG|nr:uncharacterized protein SmJEL517_g04723 [Synchytrium microbalum]TPX32138.1 hypothetical protein SmJEL517_g04723 [Synchytrium microbalum]